MSVVVLGANGMAGFYIASYLSESGRNVTALNGRDIDIKDPSCLRKYINEGTLCIINCIGSIPHRKADLAEQIAVNSVWPQILSVWLRENFCRVKLIHLSTDCVFQSADLQKSFYEGENPCGDSSYGMTKACGEPKSCMVIRTSIIGEERRNLFGLVEWVKSAQNIIPGWEDHMWNGITCLELAKVIGKIIDSGMYWQGPKHVYTAGQQVTKCKLVAMIAARWNRGLKVLLTNSGKPTSRMLCSVSTPLVYKTIETQLDEMYEWGKNRFNRRQ